MTRFILAMFATISLASYAAVTSSGRAAVILPNPKLLGCQSATCSQFWLDKDPPVGAVYPVQITIDISNGSRFGLQNGSPYGLMAVYDKSVPIEDLTASINAVYGQWAYGSLPVELWRIAPEKFAMSLSACKNDEPGCDAGMTKLIYLPIGVPSTPYRPPQ